ncbi:MAG: hypothetical protein KDE59_30945 [Anaerolineales bacterium]|nr:hypothetical protein [Anaerolineales bacterium]
MSNPNNLLDKANELIADSGGGGGRWSKQKTALLLIHLAILLYTATHGISASLHFAGDSNWQLFGQIVGVVITEVTILAIYVLFALGYFTDTGEQIAAGATYALCFVIVALSSVVDATINAGGTIPAGGLLAWHLAYGLPLSPVLVGIGVTAMKGFSGDVWANIREKTTQREADKMAFDARIATEKAGIKTAQQVEALKLASQLQTAENMAKVWASDTVQRAIQSQALANLPALLASAGIEYEPGSDTRVSVNRPNHPTSDELWQSIFDSETRESDRQWRDAGDDAGSFRNGS